MNPLLLLLLCVADWMDRQQQIGIEYLREEIRVLKGQLNPVPRCFKGVIRVEGAKGSADHGIAKGERLVHPPWARNEKPRRSGASSAGQGFL